MDNTSFFGKSERNVIEWSTRIIKVVLAVVIVAVVWKYQVNRPKVPNHYKTHDPNDNFRDGVNYTCGCSLPTTMEDPPYPTEISNVTFDLRNRSSWKNICQDKSTIESVHVLMYPNFTQVHDGNFTQAGRLDSILQNAYGDDFTKQKETRQDVPGYHIFMQAHDISWHNDTFLDPLSGIYLTGNPKQRQLKLPVDYLLNNNLQSGGASQDTVTPFLDFPTSYVNLALAYNCTDCSRCPLESVNQIFTNISGNSNSIWGRCDYWWNKADDPCGNGSQNWYTAKCVMYPTEALPLNYAIDDFLHQLSDLLSGSAHIFTPEDLANTTGAEVLDWSQKSFASFSANVLHMEFSQVENGSVQLSFFEIEEYSAGWLAIVDTFPTADFNCSNLMPVEVATGTAICNVFTDSKNKDFDNMCIEMTNKSDCEERFIRKNDRNVNVTVDTDENLWGEFNVTERDWSKLMCMKYENISVPPYLVSSRTAEAMQNSSLNRFLESKFWSANWTQNSGVCVNSYTDVSPQTVVEGNKSKTVFMETKCHNAGYCWLTGRYHQLTDIPDQNWHNIPLDDPPDLFACYVFRDQSAWIWLLLTCGILFGWLGTADLICKWIIFPFVRLLWHNFHKRRNISNGIRVTARVTDSAIASDKLEVVVVRGSFGKSLSDTAVILGRRKPGVESKLCPPLAEAEGG